MKTIYSMSVAELADAIHKDLLTLPNHNVRAVFRLVMKFKYENAPDIEERRKRAMQKIMEIREKYKDRVKDNSPFNREELYDRKILR